MAQTRHHAGGFDAARQQLGNVYAKALLGATENAGNSDAVLAEFDSLIDDVLDKLPQLDSLLASPRVSHEEKLRVLDSAFQDRMSPQLFRFLKVTAAHGRLDCLRAINDAAHRRYNEMRGRVEVRVFTARRLPAELLEQIASRLRVALQSEVDLETDVDPELIVGLVVRVGDTVYDASVSNRLQRLRAETFEKTVQEIRQSLDRFALAE